MIRISSFRYLFLIFHIFIFTGACDNSIRKDLSLNPEAYKALHIPDPSDNWDLDDYWKAHSVLIRLKNEKPYSLPRSGSPKSGRYFSRMIDPANLAFLEDNSLSLKERAYRIQNFSIIQSELTDVYTNVYGEEQYYNRELVDLYIFGLVIAHKMLKLAERINDSDDAEAMNLKAGFKVMQHSYLSTLFFILSNQKKKSIYRTDDLERLADSIYNSVMDNKEWMTVSSRENLRKEIMMVMDSTSSSYILKKYKELAETL